MKIVINTTYGGFGLSDACTEELAVLKGHKAYKYTFDNRGLSLHRCHEETYAYCSCRFLLDVDQEEIDRETAKRHHFESLFEGNEMRTDPDLISLIEKNGTQWASGDYAELKIIEIPDDVDWVIGEDEGKEWVEEKRRVWGLSLDRKAKI